VATLMRRAKEGIWSDRVSAAQQLLGSCDLLSQTAHVRCEGLLRWSTDPMNTYVGPLRVPASCHLDLAGAIAGIALSDADAAPPLGTIEAVQATLEKWNRTPTLVSGAVLLQSTGFLSEKNWSPFPFSDPTALGIVYSFQPFVVGTLPAGWESAAAFNTVDGLPQPGCYHCYNTSSSEAPELIDLLLTQGVASATAKLTGVYALPLPYNVSVQEKGDTAIHLNGVQLLHFSRFAGHEDVLLGIVHMVSQATWKADDVTTGSAVLYHHYFFLATSAGASTDASTSANAPPISPFAISRDEIPLEVAPSDQLWFGDCGQLQSSVLNRSAWNETGGGDTARGAACALRVAFVSGFERVDDTLHILYGVGDAKSRLMRMSVTEAEQLFAA